MGLFSQKFTLKYLHYFKSKILSSLNIKPAAFFANRTSVRPTFKSTHYGFSRLFKHPITFSFSSAPKVVDSRRTVRWVDESLCELLLSVIYLLCYFIFQIYTFFHSTFITFLFGEDNKVYIKGGSAVDALVQDVNNKDF